MYFLFYVERQIVQGMNMSIAKDTVQWKASVMDFMTSRMLAKFLIVAVSMVIFHLNSTFTCHKSTSKWLNQAHITATLPQPNVVILTPRVGLCVMLVCI